MGTRIEGLLTVVLTGFWAASVAIVSETTGNVGLGLLDGSVLVSRNSPVKSSLSTILISCTYDRTVTSIIPAGLVSLLRLFCW